MYYITFFAHLYEGLCICCLNYVKDHSKVSHFCMNLLIEYQILKDWIFFNELSMLYYLKHKKETLSVLL